MMRVAVGTVARFLVAFVNRELTTVEQQALLTAGILPAGVGVDQPTVQLDYWVDLDPADSPPTATLTAPAHDATGVYHFDRLVDTPGIWQYAGYSLDAPAGSRLARTLAGRFTATVSS